MGEIVDLDGIVVDTEDGEIIARSGELDEGDLAAWVAQNLRDAKEQKKGWERREVAFTAVLIRLQGQTRKVTYGNFVAAITQSTYSVQDTGDFVEDVKRLEPSREMLLALLEAAKSFDPAALVNFPELVAALGGYTTKKPKKPYVLISPVLRAAPKGRPMAGRDLAK